MNDVVVKMIAALVTAFLVCICTVKMPCAMQQGGYENRAFWRWLKRKDNLLFNRLAVLSLCLALTTAVTVLCFSFFGVAWAQLCSSLPFVGLLLFFWRADSKYALKVPAKLSARLLRLFAVYFLYVAIFSYALVAFLEVLAIVNGSVSYALVAYVPYALVPLSLPIWLTLANATTRPFEVAHNRKFVKRAGQVLDESKIIRVAVVGSYGKTSVKNILKTLLKEKYSVVETPASYNTPMGIAKTVFSANFENKEILLAEMGARKAGDIRELCALVRPDYAVFVGVCGQHIASFGSLDGVFEEKSEILRSGAKTVVCGESLREKIGENFKEQAIVYAGGSQIKALRLSGTATAFTLALGGGEIEVKTSLLGRGNAENIALAATLCVELGLTAAEIKAGIEKLQPVPHRLQLLENNGVYILDDGYNCNIEGAKAALEVLAQFSGGRCVVTPGIVEGGILEEELNERLGAEIATRGIEKVILVGDTLVGAVKEGYLAAGGDKERLESAQSLDLAREKLAKWIKAGDAVLFLNDLPDLY